MTGPSSPPATLPQLLAQINFLACRLRQCAAAHDPELATAELDVLEILNTEGAATVPEIARKRRTSRQNIQVIVDRLAPGGLVELHPNPAHKSSPLVLLTKSGKQRLEAGQRAQQDLLGAIQSGISQREIENGLAILAKVSALLPSGRAAPSRLPRQERANPLPLGVSNSDGEGWVSPAGSAVEEFPVNLL